MNAQSLVELLLEMNVINARDIDMEIAKLAARLSDPRAKSWFKRVPRFFLINIDRLLSEPYKAKAEPRGFYGRKFYADPKGGWMGGYKLPSGEEVIPGRNPPEVPPEKMGQPWPEEEMAGQPGACDQCSGTGRVRQIQHHGTGENVFVAADPVNDPPQVQQEYRLCPKCGGSGKKPREALKSAHGKLPPELQQKYLAKLEPEQREQALEHWIARQFGLAEATPFDPKGMDPRYRYDPKEQTYTTAFHEPPIRRDIEQSFRRFVPKKAKAKEIYGGAPTKKELQPWMTAPEAEQKEFYHFDPIQMRRRELWSKMSTLVNFLNYQHKLANQAEFEDERERTNSGEADKLLDSLIQMRPDDIEGFRAIMKQAYEFAIAVKEEPWLYSKDGKAIAEINDLQLRKVMFPETAIAFSRRGQREETRHPDPNREGYFQPVWCTRDQGHAVDYTRQGDLFFIDKDEMPYVLLHFPTHQVRNVQNTTINPEVAQEIAPLFADRQRFPAEDLVQMPVLARVIEIPDQATPVMDLPGGWRLLRLDHTLDLQREGVIMDHCVGNTTYTDMLQQGTHQFFSLRDPENKPYVTIEVARPNKVEQMKGVHNSLNHTEEVKQMLRQVIQRNGWQVDGDQRAIA
jgi:hypothetical protein